LRKQNLMQNYYLQPIGIERHKLQKYYKQLGQGWLQFQPLLSLMHMNSIQPSYFVMHKIL
jgi:hypothetical protein